MNLLAFDTSTDFLSLALACGQQRTGHTGPGGAQASATLIPALMGLLEAAGLRLPGLDAIVFGRGPGSFTGLRTACAVAQGLAFGSGVPVLPVETLLAVAEDARDRHGATRVMALLDARMDQVYAGAYLFDGGQWQRQGELALLAPEEVQVPAGWALAGNAFAAYGARLAAGAPRLDAMPTAGALLRLAPGLLAAGQAQGAAGALPLYLRDKVAQTTAERAAVRAAGAAATPT